MKKLIALALTLLLVLVVAIPAWADDTGPVADVGSAASVANPEVALYTHGHWPNWFHNPNTKGNSWNNNTYLTSLVIAYGSPSAPDSTGIARYLGESTVGENITNVLHPYDVLDVQYLDELNWVPQPWSHTNSALIAADVTGDYGTIVPNSELDGRTELTDSEGASHNMNQEIYNGLHITDPTYMRKSDLNINWAQFTHIWDPPTTSTWGCGIMYDVGSNMSTTLADAPVVYYKTVMLPPWHMPALVMTPSTATVQVGGAKQYRATFYWNSQNEVNGHDVTTQAAWTNDAASIATIGSSTGIATGLAQGSTNIIASYQPPAGPALTGTATLTVQGQQQPPNGAGGGPGLSMVAVNQATWSTTPLVTQKNGTAKKVTRPTNTAKWTDQITATLTTTDPGGASYVPRGAIYDGDTWIVKPASISYPLRDTTFPVDPKSGVTTSQPMTPNGHTATTQFKENWSLDGFDIGVYDVFTKTVVGKNPSTWPITAKYTLACTVRYHYMVKHADGQESPGPEQSLTFNSTGTATQTLTVNGAGTMPEAQEYTPGVISAIIVSTD